MAKLVAWTRQARADVRSLDQTTAMQVLEGLARYVASGQGDVKQLKGTEPPELRLRVGNYRVRYYDHGDSIEVIAVGHRKEVYR